MARGRAGAAAHPGEPHAGPLPRGRLAGVRAPGERRARPEHHRPLRRSREAWGTPETVDGLRSVAQGIATLYPGRGDLIVTDISRMAGGHLNPHRTHQNGRDVDVLLYANGDLPRARDL